MCSENLHPLFKAGMHLPSCNTLVLRVLHAGDTVQVLLSTAEEELAALQLCPKKVLLFFQLSYYLCLVTRLFCYSKIRLCLNY